jgi:hypothetical protein
MTMARCSSDRGVCVVCKAKVVKGMVVVNDYMRFDCFALHKVFVPKGTLL